MPISAKKIIDKINKTSVKKNFTVSLNPAVMEEFKATCRKQAVKFSPVIEELLKGFVASTKRK